MGEGLVDSFIPERVIIKNFNNIDEISIPIPEITVITGDNGSGKTSVIEAIDFCLTGQILRDVPASSIIKNGETAAEVKITGKYNNAPIEITRTRTKNGTRVKIITGTGDDAEEIENPTEFLSGIVTHDEFKNIFLIDGHDLNKFVAGGKEASEILDKMFGIDSIDKITKDISRGLLSVEKRIVMLTSTIDTLKRKREILSKASESVVDPDVIADEIKRTTEVAKKLDSDAITIDAEWDAINKDVREKIVAIKRDTDVLLRIDDLNRRKKYAEDKITENEKRRADILGNAARSGNLNTIELELRSLRDDLSTTVARIDMWKDIPAMITKILDTATTGDACPVCLTPGKKNDAMANAVMVQADQKKKLKDLLSKKIDITKEIGEKERVVNELHGIKSSIERIDIENGTFAKTIQEIDREITTTPPVDKIKNLASEKEIETLRESSNKLREQSIEMRARVSEMNRNIATLKERMLKLKRPAETWKEMDETELSARISESNDLQIKKGHLVELKAGMKNVLSSIRERIMETINPDIGRCIDRFGNKKTAITKFEIVPKTKMIKGETHFYYDYKVEVNGVPLSFDALSTGQKALVLISIVITMITYTKSALSMIVFDEIDSCGLDRENIHVILKSIVSLSKKMRIVFVDRDQNTIKFLTDEATKKGGTVPVITMQSSRAPATPE